MHRQTQNQCQFHSCCAPLNKKWIKERKINIPQSKWVSEGVLTSALPCACCSLDALILVLLRPFFIKKTCPSSLTALTEARRWSCWASTRPSVHSSTVKFPPKTLFLFSHHSSFESLHTRTLSSNPSVSTHDVFSKKERNSAGKLQNGKKKRTNWII